MGSAPGLLFLDIDMHHGRGTDTLVSLVSVLKMLFTRKETLLLLPTNWPSLPTEHTEPRGQGVQSPCAWLQGKQRTSGQH